MYGTVTWHAGEQQHKKSSYKLDLEKVYICSTVNAADDYVPTYDPDGSVYHDGPQFGCAKPHKYLKHRLLLLNRESKSNTNYENDKFDAKFLTEKALRQCTTSNSVLDGFEFSLKNLFALENRTNSFYEQATTDSLWYVQAIFVVRPLNSNTGDEVLHKRAKRLSLISSVYNNGTNMRSFRLVTKANSLDLDRKQMLINEDTLLRDTVIYHKNKFGSSDLLLKILMPLAIISMLVFALVSILYAKKRTVLELIRSKEMRKTKKQQLSNFSKNISFKKIRKRMSANSRTKSKSKITLDDLFERNANSGNSSGDNRLR